MKEIAVDYDRVPRTLVLLGYHTDLPPELATLTVHFALSLPDPADIQASSRKRFMLGRLAIRRSACMASMTPTPACCATWAG